MLARTVRSWCLVVGALACLAGCDVDDAGGAAARRRHGEDWTQWGGPDGNFRVEAAGLDETWPPEGPPRLWQRDLGPGYSAIAARDGRLYTMYREGEQDVVVALDAATGETLWDNRYPGRVHNGNMVEFGVGPNAMPLALADRIVTLGYGGRLQAVDAERGTLLWSRDLVDEFDAAVLEFGYSASPVLIDGNVVVLVGGERHGIVAFDPADGSVVWGGEPGSVSYATPVAIAVDGRPQIVYLSADEIIGVDPADGRKLWSWPCVNRYRNNASPPQWNPRTGVLWVSTQLDGGTRALGLSQTPDGTSVEQLWFDDGIKIHFWNSVLIDDTVYASIGGQVTLFAAVDLASGEILWRERGYSKINSIYTGDRLIFLDENGHLGMARVSPTGFARMAETRVSDETTWTVPTLVGTRLYVRDPSRVMAFELGVSPAAVDDD